MQLSLGSAIQPFKAALTRSAETRTGFGLALILHPLGTELLAEGRSRQSEDAPCTNTSPLTILPHPVPVWHNRQLPSRWLFPTPNRGLWRSTGSAG